MPIIYKKIKIITYVSSWTKQARTKQTNLWRFKEGLRGKGEPAFYIKKKKKKTSKMKLK